MVHLGLLLDIKAKNYRKNMSKVDYHMYLKGKKRKKKKAKNNKQITIKKKGGVNSSDLISLFYPTCLLPSYRKIDAILHCIAPYVFLYTCIE